MRLDLFNSPKQSEAGYFYFFLLLFFLHRKWGPGRVGLGPPHEPISTDQSPCTQPMRKPSARVCTCGGSKSNQPNPSLQTHHTLLQLISTDGSSLTPTRQHDSTTARQHDNISRATCLIEAHPKGIVRSHAAVEQSHPPWLGPIRYSPQLSTLTVLTWSTQTRFLLSWFSDRHTQPSRAYHCMPSNFVPLCTLYAHDGPPGTRSGQVVAEVVCRQLRSHQSTTPRRATL